MVVVVVVVIVVVAAWHTRWVVVLLCTGRVWSKKFTYRGMIEQVKQFSGALIISVIPVVVVIVIVKVYSHPRGGCSSAGKYSS